MPGITCGNTNSMNLLVDQCTEGDMSTVGPRPGSEALCWPLHSRPEKVLQVRPGITDMASIAYKKENEILALSSDPEQTYINEIMPEKIKLNMVLSEPHFTITSTLFLKQFSTLRPRNGIKPVLSSRLTCIPDYFGRLYQITSVHCMSICTHEYFPNHFFSQNLK